MTTPSHTEDREKAKELLLSLDCFDDEMITPSMIEADTDLIARAIQAAKDEGWQDMSSAPTDGYGCFYTSVLIGAVRWGKDGRVHEHVGPIEWMNDHWEFIGVDFDVFPPPTSWRPLPSPPHVGTKAGERT